MLSKTSSRTIAIIDSGIDCRNTNIIKRVTGGITIQNGELKEGFQDENGHGTKCVSILMKYCKEADFFIIKTLNKNLEGMSADIIQALDYLKESDVSIINLSLSTDNKLFMNDYKNVCNELKSRGKVIVAARDNQIGHSSYPASLDSVIGVQGSIYLNESEYLYNKLNEIQVICSSIPKLTLSINRKYELFSGNSKACAIFTSIIYNHISMNSFNTVNIDKKLCELAKKYDNNYISNNQFSFKLKDKDKDKDINKELLLKIKKVIKNTLKLELDSYKLLDDYILFYRTIGLNNQNCIKLIQNIEKEFCVNINYENVSFFDCLSPYALAMLILRSMNEKKSK